jgi:4-amino-4-deoxy-L-arabinose transferase-like glycosyltransferase
MLTATGVGLLVTDGGAVSILVIAVFSFVFVEIFRRYSDEKEFVTWIFLGALAARLGFGLFVHTYDLREFFGGDANTYDFRGWMLASQWVGDALILKPEVQLALQARGSGWGMNYLVAIIYSIIGRNILAAQSFCAVIGAATAPMVYFCAQKVFQNRRVATTAAILTAFFPAFIIWSGQLLKDGLIIFLLVLAMTLVRELQERFSLASVILLTLSIGGILTLRFYIFYMVAVAIAGSFVIGLTSSTQALVRNTIILVIVGVGLTYVGVIRNATSQLETFGTVDQLKRSREDLAKSAKSGFGEDVDVTTTAGAIGTIPLGFAYLMFAPFPWQLGSLRQSITLPEVLLWWAMIPVLAWGLWWAIRHRLRRAFPILLFSLMLTLAYSIFIGNVGTAYRQRTQIQVFLFMFIAVGIELWREQRENKVLKRMSRDRARRMLGVRTT